MNYRRQFLRYTGAFTAGALILPQWACNNAGNETAEGATAETSEVMEAKPSLSNFGLQLYTLRDDFPKDPKGVLQQIAEMGYTQIEGYEGDQGVFWGMTNTEFKQHLDSLGLTMVSSHCNINENFEEKAAQAAEIGMKYLISPWVGPQATADDYKKIADNFNSRGEICKQNGLRFAYHNHDYSFKETEGQMPQDIFMAGTDPELVDFEMDIYWVVTAGADPITWLEKYPNRWRLCHVKDRIKDAPAEDHEASTDLGTGSIDFAKILGVAEKQGMQYYILEQELYKNSTPLQSAKVGAEYLKKLTFS